MEAMIQVFPDDFHLRTLNALLEATSKLVAQVNIKQIIITFIDRLAAFALRERDADGQDEATAEGEPKKAWMDEIPLFDIFWEQVSNIIKTRTELTLGDSVGLLLSLMNLSMSCYPERLDYVDKIYGLAKELFSSDKRFVITTHTAHHLVTLVTT